jgi:hypothetical protein
MGIGEQLPGIDGAISQNAVFRSLLFFSLDSLRIRNVLPRFADTDTWD